MRALTIRQPWADLIAAGTKLIENRAGTTRYRGPLAIHAGGTFSEDASHDPRVRHALGRRPLRGDYTDDRFGHLIAVVDLVDVHQAQVVPGRGPCCQPWGDGEYGTGRRIVTAHHLVLANPRPIDPAVRVLGKLGLWRLDPTLAQRLELLVA
jgi:hypothetical protein